MAEVRTVGERLYAQGHTDVGDLTAAIARAVGPGGAIYAGVIAAEIVRKAKTAVDEAKTNVVGNISEIGGVVRDAVELPTRIIRWLGEPGSWLRIAYVAGGGAMILIAVAMLVKGPATAVAGKIITKGK